MTRKSSDFKHGSSGSIATATVWQTDFRNQIVASPPLLFPRAYPPAIVMNDDCVLIMLGTNRRPGEISLDDFVSLPELRLNPLAERAVALVDKNDDKEIEFNEFVSALSLYAATLDPREKLQRAAVGVS